MMKRMIVILAFTVAACLGSCGSAENESTEEAVVGSVAQETENKDAGAETEVAVDAEAEVAVDAEAEPEQEAADEESTIDPEADKVTYEIDPTKPMVAITFDDGPNTTTTVEILDVLEEYGVRASFFVIGNNINNISAEVMKRAFNMGCEINNHSQTHSNMTTLTAEQIKEEIQYTSDKVEEVVGVPTKFFRPPYISVNTVMYEQIEMPFICGYGCNDWEATVDAETRATMVLEQVEDGAIILLHDFTGNHATVEAMKTIIPELLEQGYQFVTVGELFEAKGVEISGSDTNLYSIVK